MDEWAIRAAYPRDKLNFDRYVNVLKKCTYSLSLELGGSSTTWTLIDDNPTCHGSSITNAYKSEVGIRVLTWPARSTNVSFI